MTRRLQTRLCLTHSLLFEYALREPGKEIMVSRLKTIFFSTMVTLRFQRCFAPIQCNLFLWNALSSRPVACPTSRTMSFHPTRRIFVPIASPATTTVLHLSSLQLRRLFRHSRRMCLDRLLVPSILLLYRCIRLHTPLPDFLHVFRPLLWIRRPPMNLLTPLLRME
jgi:hypothetical protein